MVDPPARVLKTAWFAKAARKARIGNVELRKAVREAMNGRADDSGGGVFKRRVGKNLYRSILLAKGGRFWVYAYLFAKKDKANISEDELDGFRLLAKSYDGLSEGQLSALLGSKDLVEIGHVQDSEIQN